MPELSQSVPCKGLSRITRAVFKKARSLDEVMILFGVLGVVRFSARVDVQDWERCDLL